MNRDRLIAHLFGMMLGMNPEYGYFNLDEMIMSTDEKIMNITLGLTFEIRELVDKGYSYEQIYELIQNIKFDDEDNVSEKEAKYLKKEAKKTLKLIINNKEKEND